MSHHLDSPLSRQDPRLNITDQYVFGTPSATVFVMNLNTSLAGADKPRGFHDEGRYEFRIHLDGSERENLTYRFTFEATSADGTQQYAVERLVGADAGRDDADGTILLHGRTGVAEGSGSGLRVRAGSAHDPFYLDLSLLDAIHEAVQHRHEVGLTTHNATNTSNTFDASMVDSIVLEVPHSDNDLYPGRSIALWSTSRLATDAGGWRQINRAGLPMMWPIFRVDDSEQASHANETHPADDAVNYGKVIADLVSDVVRRRDTSIEPDDYGRRVAARLTPDVLPYVLGSEASLDLLGFNGRNLTDNAPEVMFCVATNSGVPTGLTSGAVANAPVSTFPYLATPAAGA